MPKDTTARQAPRYAFYGTLLGLMFPVVGTAIRFFQGVGPIQAQRTDPLLWLIDCTPFVVGLVAWLGGVRHDRAVAARVLLDERAADFDAAASALELTLERAGQHGEQLTRARGELNRLAKVAAHDLAAPLVGIRNLAQWVREDMDEETSGGALDHLDRLEQRVERMQRLVRKIEEYASAGRTNHQELEVDLEQLTRETFSRASGSPRFELETKDLPTLHTARKPLVTVLRALLHNAITHHDLAEGRITVTAVEASPFIEIHVLDDGPGVHPRYRERVFDLFETLERRDEKEASGAGLAIAKKTVLAHGGEISIARREGRGTEVVFTWPLSLDDEPSELNTVVRRNIASVLQKRKTLAGEPSPER